ncbi:FAD-dependent oxidoreductase [Clostridium paraputrificum]|uniref:NAD(P)/FAD-dependent oxidoreductase n=1 Tax=Clostridium TaxID=1485 RepID=UPI000C079092|nr:MULTISPECIES: FAD-binding protein [Clostridium]MBS7130969.1 FAD-dependent oxidoreductase [Clostridium sp.]MDB2076529.1 FAD-dependent oxidoreductase [Clostridium paraputrificum]MDB2080090.1 FAD-dependent oxidoreductase [Clostridium paraputrificum]MDB2093689.1 FAD-dependent oxidoreductase [Clostridium paraputrificum]MDU1033186.1 FAD-dependent oxidoreductase [Clostridium sp.]
MNYDVIIVGAGPAGIFTAYELKKQKPQSKILLIEAGKQIDKRHCPKDRTNVCVSCKPYCHITSGFSGAGAFSDGKLSLSYEVGGDLPNLVGAKTAQEFIDYTDKIYLDFGADTKIEGIDNNDAVKEIRRKAIQGGLKLVDCPIRHLGTEKAQEIYLKIQNHLLEVGVEIKFDTLVKNLIIENNSVTGALLTDALTKKKDEEVFSNKVVVATGRKGADWLKDMCVEHNINHSAGPVDIGVRVELRNEVMESVNNVLYESKLIGHPLPFKDKVRTFCQNPGGFVSQENYDNNLAIVNGHSYKNLKSDNTNLAILSSHNFAEPFNEPIEYGKKVAELVNMLGNGKILVQRYGDILDGKRTWEHELYESNVKHTLPDAEAGDLTSAMPYRTMTNILNFIEAMDTVVPGFASRETLLYGPEIKFYSNKIKLDTNFETNIKGLHCLGDSSGWTRGLMMASAMGVMMGRLL